MFFYCLLMAFYMRHNEILLFEEETVLISLSKKKRNVKEVYIVKAIESLEEKTWERL